MKYKRIYKEFKDYDGGVLKFYDKNTNKKYYFEMNFKQFLPIYNELVKNKGLYVLLDSNGKHLIYSDLTKLGYDYDLNEIEIGTMIRNGNHVMAICDKEVILRLLEKMMCPEKESRGQSKEVEISAVFESEEDPIVYKKSKPFFSFGKQKEKKPSFDWDEHYREGLRIFEDDEDEAEAYADEMKQKITGKYW